MCWNAHQALEMPLSDNRTIPIPLDVGAPSTGPRSGEWKSLDHPPLSGFLVRLMTTVPPCRWGNTGGGLISLHPSTYNLQFQLFIQRQRKGAHKEYAHKGYEGSLARSNPVWRVARACVCTKTIDSTRPFPPCWCGQRLAIANEHTSPRQPTWHRETPFGAARTPI